VSSIIRVVHKEKPFLMIDKATIADLKPDLQALGLLVVILAKADDWQVRPEELARELGVTARSVYRIISRLIDARYIVRIDETRRKEDGRFDRRTCYTVYEDRSMAPKPMQDTRISGREVPF
jgi:DNA-binding MarR family transcriptional regulator